MDKFIYRQHHKKLYKPMRICMLIFILLMCVGCYISGYIYGSKKVQASTVQINAVQAVHYDSVAGPIQVEVPVKEVEKQKETHLPSNDVDLLALVTMAEAEGEPVEGQRLVIDTILNRVDSSSFPNTISGVVYQKNAFECMWNGRVNRCYVKEDIRNLVLEELQNRTDSEVVYFRTGRYSDYGTPNCKVGNHYFSYK